MALVGRMVLDYFVLFDVYCFSEFSSKVAKFVLNRECGTMFQAYIEKEDSKKLKQKQREKVQPKMGKMDIDYQVMCQSSADMLLPLHGIFCVGVLVVLLLTRSSFDSTGYAAISQVLHDAFFKFQTKPKLTSHGDLYHEGKEFEVSVPHQFPFFLLLGYQPSNY